MSVPFRASRGVPLSPSSMRQQVPQQQLIQMTKYGLKEPASKKTGGNRNASDSHLGFGNRLMQYDNLLFIRIILGNSTPELLNI